MGWCRLSVRVLPPSDSVAVLLSSPRPADVADEPPASPLAPVRAPLATRREGGPAAQHHAPGIRNKQSTCTCAGGGRRTPATVRVVCAAEVVRLALLRVDRLRLLASNRRRQDARAQAGRVPQPSILLATNCRAHTCSPGGTYASADGVSCAAIYEPSQIQAHPNLEEKKEKERDKLRQSAGGGEKFSPPSTSTRGSHGYKKGRGRGTRAPPRPRVGA